MEKFYHKLFKNTLSVALTVIISSLMIIGIVFATTTIGTNVTTDGTLSVTGLSTFGRATSTSATSTEYLYVGPDITEDANINFAGGDLVVADALNVGGVTYLDGALQATSTSLFTGATTFYSTVNVSGLTTLGAATSTSATTTAYLYVGHDISEPTGWDFSGGDLAVAGDAYFNNKATTSVALVVGAPTPTYINYAGGDLIVQGDVEVDGGLWVNSATTTDTLVVGSVASTTDYLIIGNSLGDDDDLIYFDIGRNESFGWDDNPGEFDLTDDLEVSGAATTTGKAVFASTAPADSATSTVTFGSYGTANTKGLCLKFFSGGVTVWCYFDTARLAGGAATSTAFVCDSDSSCETN